MKKILILLLAFSMSFTLISCNNATTDKDKSDKESSSQIETTTSIKEDTTTITNDETTTSDEPETTTERKKKKYDFDISFTEHPEYSYVLNYTDIIESNFSEITLNPGETLDCKAKIHELGYGAEHYEFFSFMFTHLCYSSVIGSIECNDIKADMETGIFYITDSQNLTLTNVYEYPITWYVKIEGDTIYFNSET